MAVIYLRSTDGNDADNGSTWALAKATLSSALAAAGAGGTVYVSQSHAQTQATALTFSSGSSSSITRIICVDDGSEPPVTLATTATVSTTGNNSITVGGTTSHLYIYGVKFTAGDSTGFVQVAVGGSSQSVILLDSCALKIGSTNSTCVFAIGGGGSSTRGFISLNNTTMEFSHASQFVYCRSVVSWKNTPSALLGTIPTVLFSPASPMPKLSVSGVDLSAAGSGKSLVDAGGLFYAVIFENCKLGAAVSPVSGSVSNQSVERISFVRCDSGDTNYTYRNETYQGVITHETVIVRTGGASDGTTSISRKLVSTANSSFMSPLSMDPIITWNDSTSSLTVTVHIVTDNVTLTDAECWIEVEELGTSGYPLSVTQSDRAADILATPANQSTSTETWTTTGLTTPVKQKLNVTFTPAEKGPIKVRVMLAKASTTVYVCPKVEVS